MCQFYLFFEVSFFDELFSLSQHIELGYRSVLLGRGSLAVAVLAQLLLCFHHAVRI